MEPAPVASFDEHGIRCRWPDGSLVSVEWRALQAVEIRTTDTGPFVEDVSLMLQDSAGVCFIPQEAEGFGPLLERVEQLPGFDRQAVISAMTCTDNASFPCWKR